jgi:succinoglycan biosynthesis protein ExoA
MSIQLRRPPAGSPLGGATDARACAAAPPAPRVLVVIPSLNEAEHLEGLITTLLAEAGTSSLRIVIADGGSTDGTCDLVRGLAERDDRVVLLASGKRIAAAINEAVGAYGGDAEFLLRMDAHAAYPAQFCARLLAVQAATGADSVVVSMLTEGRTCFQRAAAAAQNSLLGNGGAAHRNEPTGRWVEHGHHALMSMAAFKAVGGYDEIFLWNEDAELDARLGAAGFRIYLAGALSIVYYPRRSLGALYRQYFNYGRGRARNVLKHRRRPRLRQLLPLAVAPALGLLLLAPLSAVFAVPAAAWALACLAFGLLLGLRARDVCAAAAGIAAMTMHVGWSLGFLAHLLAQGRRGGFASDNGKAG